MVPGAKVRVLPVSRRHLSVVPDLPVQLPQRPTQPVPHRLESMDRDEAITKIRTALKGRSDKRWSVRGGTGTAWGWITITAPPSRRGEHGEMTAEDTLRIAQHIEQCAPCLAQHDLDHAIKDLVRRSCQCEEAPAELRMTILQRITSIEVRWSD